ncbi:MAG TPA: ABC-F family ATP-binding cassette domain-containing protein [Longimicrobiales bacterium]|nr:ABC-F family ATP-binding cassette domain-containing protein [Longimicrobiales bacterium]
MISVSNLARSFGDNLLFESASFQLNPGCRYGLVGANGSGKSTLLSILSGDLDADEGVVSIPKDIRLGVLRQDQFEYDDVPVVGVALMGIPELWEAMQEKEALLARAEADPESFETERFGELEEIVQRYDGYAAEARAATILEGLGIPAEVHHEPMSVLSGGFKLRVLLARVLASDPDVLMLDEPTNHLDILSIRWLEKFLHAFTGPVVVISHDHRFLDNVSTHILDVDYRTVTLYTGNYTDFQESKKLDRERREKEIESREKEIQQQQDFVDRFRAKASKARQAQSKLRMIEKMADGLEELPGSSRRYPKFRFEPKRPSGREVLKVEGVSKAFDDNVVLEDVDLKVERGDRVAIIGPNGVGKSTLLKITMDRLAADAGEVEWGYETHVGYFAQDHADDFDDTDRTTEEWLWDYCPGKDRGYVRGQMGMMLFSGDEGEKKMSALSGGEAARMVFARLMLERPNVLVLDEPTNHLDMESIEALVEGLKTFDGTLILVSHDRWFVRQLATRIVEIKPGEIVDYPGTYEEFVHASGDDHLDAEAVLRKAKREKKAEKKGEKGSGKNGARRDGGKGAGRNSARNAERRVADLQRRSEKLLDRIGRDEARIAEILSTFAESGYYTRTDEAEIERMQSELENAKRRVSENTAEWEEVERKATVLQAERT